LSRRRLLAIGPLGLSLPEDTRDIASATVAHEGSERAQCRIGVGCRERAVNAISRSKLNDSFGTDSGPSRCDSGAPAIRPEHAFIGTPANRRSGREAGLQDSHWEGPAYAR
jgi:hypothetical protein